MADPFRLRVLKALTNQIKTISPTNGYTLDLRDFTDEAGRPARRVFRGRDIFGFSDLLPMVSILENPRPLEQDNAKDGGNKGQWELMIQGFVQDDPENPTDPAYLLAAEVVVAIARAKANR